MQRKKKKNKKKTPLSYSVMFAQLSDCPPTTLHPPRLLRLTSIHSRRVLRRCQLLHKTLYDKPYVPASPFAPNYARQQMDRAT